MLTRISGSHLLIAKGKVALVTTTVDISLECDDGFATIASPSKKQHEMNNASILLFDSYTLVQLVPLSASSFTHFESDPADTIVICQPE
jgi:hypothetical protein